MDKDTHKYRQILPISPIFWAFERIFRDIRLHKWLAPAVLLVRVWGKPFRIVPSDTLPELFVLA